MAPSDSEKVLTSCATWLVFTLMGTIAVWFSQWFPKDSWFATIVKPAQTQCNFRFPVHSGCLYVGVCFFHLCFDANLHPPKWDRDLHQQFSLNPASTLENTFWHATVTLKLALALFITWSLSWVEVTGGLVAQFYFLLAGPKHTHTHTHIKTNISVLWLQLWSKQMAGEVI